MADVNLAHYCVLRTTENTVGKPKAALLNAFKWQPGTEVKVQFVEGDPTLQDRVAAVAAGWTGPKMANLSLRFVGPDAQDADARVAFQQGNGSWSYLGTMCQQIPVNEPTMNYGWLTPDSPDDEVQRVVLHEFGHLMGLIHEHQNPNHPIDWNRAAVKAALSGPPNNWDDETIEENIFKKYDPAALSSTPLDALSIMMYPIPAAWTNDDFSAGLNKELSETDQEFIRGAYQW